MKNGKITGFSFPSLAGMARLVAFLCLIFSWSAQATAPRIAPQMFGEEKKADIVGYQIAAMDADARLESEVALEIVKEAFKAAGNMPTVDVLPSRHLAIYALLNNDVAAMIGNPQDLSAKDRKHYSSAVFYLGIVQSGKKPSALIFGGKHARGDELHQAFNGGLQKIIRNGKYLAILEKYYGKNRVPADYVSRLQQLNPNLK